MRARGVVRVTTTLIVHGEEDANPGTTPLPSHKLKEAIRGNGGTARLVILRHDWR